METTDKVAMDLQRTEELVRQMRKDADRYMNGLQGYTLTTPPAFKVSPITQELLNRPVVNPRFFIKDIT